LLPPVEKNSAFVIRAMPRDFGAGAALVPFPAGGGTAGGGAPPAGGGGTAVPGAGAGGNVRG
jgi:hypothetical protein